jgi:hypothetical protein
MTAKGRRLVSCTVARCGDIRKGPSHRTVYFGDHQKYGCRGPNLHLEIADLTEQGWPPSIESCFQYGALRTKCKTPDAPLHIMHKSV